MEEIGARTLAYDPPERTKDVELGRLNRTLLAFIPPEKLNVTAFNVPVASVMLKTTNAFEGPLSCIPHALLIFASVKLTIFLPACKALTTI